VLGVYGDGLTTDHISPGGEIPLESPAGQYLRSVGVPQSGFNSYVGRRGNHHVMTAGTYGNVRIRNRMAAREGWWTRMHPGGEEVTIPDAARQYAARKIPLIVLGGHDMGAGSSRDWAAKGPALLGVNAVLARSFERIHRSNLIGVGIVPLVFAPDENVETLGLDGSEQYAFDGIADGVAKRTPIHVTARRARGEQIRFSVHADVRSAAEIDLLQRGGMFQAALRRFL
jgi:aconitate hydratase